MVEAILTYLSHHRNDSKWLDGISTLMGQDGWKLVKQIMNASKSTRSSCPPHIDDTVIIDATEKANIMNNYFARQSGIDTSNTDRLVDEIPDNATLSKE